MLRVRGLLKTALGVVGGQSVQYQRYKGQVTDSAGYKVISWGDPFRVCGNVQPVGTDLKQEYKLDMERSYVTLYACGDMQDVDRDRTGDRFTFAGRLYQIESITPWAAQNGWGSALAVDITNAKT